jgi:hypothetical protein
MEDWTMMETMHYCLDKGQVIPFQCLQSHMLLSVVTDFLVTYNVTDEDKSN